MKSELKKQISFSAKINILALFYFFFLFPNFAYSSEKIEITGQVLEKGTRKPLSNVNVFILPLGTKGTTDSKGNFQISDLPAGEYEVVINVTGYLKFSKKLSINQSQSPLQFFIERQSYQIFETTVSDLRTKKDVSSKTLKQEDFLQTPGSGGDPVKAVQNLPGVNRANGSDSRIIIQGSDPDDTRYNINGHEVPLIFHFGGLSSIVTPEAVGSVDYFSAGYGPFYGKAIGGHVGLNVRKPKKDRHHGMAFMDFFNVGGLVEGPIDETSSYLVSGRYSYVGAVLKRIAEDNENLNLTVAPTFADFNIQYDKRLNDRDELNVFSIYSKDQLEFVLNRPAGNDPKIRGNFYQQTQFYRFIPRWTRQIDEDHRLEVSLGVGKNDTLTDVGDNYFKLRSTTVTQRTEYEKRFSSTWLSQFGSDINLIWFNIGVKLPNTFSSGGVANPFSTGELRETQLDSRNQNFGLYWKNEVKADEDSKWTYLPGLRVDHFSTTNENLPQPRLSLKYAVSDSLQYRSALGLFYQEPTGQESNKTFGNPQIKAERAIHFALGFDKDFREGQSEGSTLSSTVFYKKLDHLVIRSSNIVERDGALTAENYTNKGEGSVIGAELQSKYKWADYGVTTSYTYAQSRRKEPGQPEYPSTYDQTHSLNVLGSYETGRWLWGARFRYVTGNPQTPVIGSYYDADNDVYTPERGGIFSTRKKDFVQLDLRADRKWIYDTWILSLYLDIQNITSQKNEEGIMYSYDYSEKNEITGLPLLPTFGVKGEF
ncbi:MAG: TonB-dependent receptor [Pseudobdellovibrionaceae bacterium]